MLKNYFLPCIKRTCEFHINNTLTKILSDLMSTLDFDQVEVLLMKLIKHIQSFVMCRILNSYLH